MVVAQISVGKSGLHGCGSESGQVAGFCEDGNELSSSIKFGVLHN
jgi:hypothetical protein